MLQSYRVRLSLKKKGGEYLIFSLPQTNEYQEIMQFSVKPKPANLFFDEWGNTAAVFSDKTNVEFLYAPKHLNKSIDEKWTLHDYKRNKLIDFFLKPNRFISGKDEKVIKLSQSLIKKEQNVLKIAQTFYDFVLEYLSYGKPTEGLYPYTQALKEKVTDCGGFSTLLLSLFQSVGIPGWLVVGFLIKENIIHKILSTFDLSFLTFDSFSMHAWPEVLLPDDTWFPMDPSIEWKRTHGKSNRDGGFGKIPRDRLVTSFGQDFKFTIGNKKYVIDLLQLPIYL